jgi:hypothetical protein
VCVSGAKAGAFFGRVVAGEFFCSTAVPVACLQTAAVTEFDLPQCQSGETIVHSPGMAAFLFRCPNTGLNVEGFVADDPPKTGKVLGGEEEE